jgi:hypothetical protein
MPIRQAPTGSPHNALMGSPTPAPTPTSTGIPAGVGYLNRPDGPLVTSINQRPPSAGRLMRPRSDSTDAFHNQASLSGFESMDGAGGFAKLTGGGSQGAVQAQQTERGEGRRTVSWPTALSTDGEVPDGF